MAYAVSKSIEVEGKYLGWRTEGVRADTSSFRSSGACVRRNRTTMRDYAVSRKYEKRNKKKSASSLLRFLPSAPSFFKGKFSLPDTHFSEIRCLGSYPSQIPTLDPSVWSKK